MRIRLSLLVSLCALGGCYDWDALEASVGNNQATATPDAGADCTGGSALCNGFCAFLANDQNNCGACGNACPTGTACQNGTCMKTGNCGGCLGLCCNGVCTNPNDVNNCGQCGNVCPNGFACQGGQCVDMACQGCPQNQCCNGGCVDIFNDPANCGVCGNACPNGQGCQNGRCGATGQSCNMLLNGCFMPCPNFTCEMMCQSMARPDALPLYRQFLQCIASQPCFNQNNCAGATSLACMMCINQSEKGACTAQFNNCMANQ